MAKIETGIFTIRWLAGIVNAGKRSEIEEK